MDQKIHLALDVGHHQVDQEKHGFYVQSRIHQTDSHITNMLFKLLQQDELL